MALAVQLQSNVGVAVHLYQAGTGSGRPVVHRLGTDDARNSDALAAGKE